MKRFAIAIIFLLSLIVSCAPTATPQPQVALATATTVPTNTPTVIPTNTPTSTSTPTVTPTPTNTPTSTPTPKPLARLHVQDTNILDDRGNIFRIKGIYMPLDVMPCPTDQEMSHFVEKAVRWNFNSINVAIDPNHYFCKQDTLAMAMDVIRQANQSGLYVVMRITPSHEPSRYGESNLTFNPTADDLKTYVELWRKIGKLIGDNPGVAAVQLYNELDYTRDIQADWTVIAQKRGEAWRTLVEPYNLNACNAVREGSPKVICLMVSADANVWYADAWNFNLPFTERFPPPNSMIAMHPYFISIAREKACEKPPTNDTWWCYPVTE